MFPACVCLKDFDVKHKGVSLSLPLSLSLSLSLSLCPSLSLSLSLSLSVSVPLSLSGHYLNDVRQPFAYQWGYGTQLQSILSVFCGYSHCICPIAPHRPIQLFFTLSHSTP